MTTLSTALRTRLAALLLPRFLHVLALALALVAIPALMPADAGAYPMSERSALRACGTLGGRAHYDFLTPEMDVYVMSCETITGRILFSCNGLEGSVWCM